MEQETHLSLCGFTSCKGLWAGREIRAGASDCVGKLLQPGRSEVLQRGEAAWGSLFSCVVFALLPVPAVTGCFLCLPRFFARTPGSRCCSACPGFCCWWGFSTQACCPLYPLKNSSWRSQCLPLLTSEHRIKTHFSVPYIHTAGQKASSLDLDSSVWSWVW